MRRIVFFILPLLLSSLQGAVAGGTHHITFAVGCYDVGAAALENRPGVLQVGKNWQRYDVYKFREVNRVEYDPQRVTVKQLEQWLKQADTWRATLPDQRKE